MNTRTRIRNGLGWFVCFSLLLEQTGFAQLPAVMDVSGRAGELVRQTETFRPSHLRFLSYVPSLEQFHLYLDEGDQGVGAASETAVSGQELFNYFLTGISLPDESFWVNLRPDAEKDTIDGLLAGTDAGRVLLEADLQLKKDTAMFTSPRSDAGKQYWERLYKKAQELYGRGQVTIPTLARPWIVPDEIIIRESSGEAYIYKATLNVKLESDHLKGEAAYSFSDKRQKELNEYAGSLMKELVLPKLRAAVNSGKRYAGLRQVYFSLILAQWFKRNFRGGQGGYCRRIDSRDLSGLRSKSPWTPAAYFNEYKKSFLQGEYNLKEEVYTASGSMARTYFSGGITMTGLIPTMPIPANPSRSNIGAGKKIREITMTGSRGGAAQFMVTVLPAGQTRETDARVAERPLINRDGGSRNALEQANDYRKQTEAAPGMAIRGVLMQGTEAEVTVFNREENREQVTRLKLNKMRRTFKGSLMANINELEHEWEYRSLVSEVLIGMIPETVALYVYQDTPAEMFGFIEGDAVCLQKDISAMPGTLLHMAGEYLVKNGKIRLTLEDGAERVITVFAEGREPVRVRLYDSEAREESLKGPDNHHLLMAVQLQIAKTSAMRVTDRIQSFDSWEALRSMLDEETMTLLQTLNAASVDTALQLAIMLKDMGLDPGDIGDVVFHCCAAQYHTPAQVRDIIACIQRGKAGGLSARTIQAILVGLSGRANNPIEAIRALTSARIALLVKTGRVMSDEGWESGRIADFLAELTLVIDSAGISTVINDEQAIRRFARAVPLMAVSRRSHAGRLFITACGHTPAFKNDRGEDPPEALIMLVKTLLDADSGYSKEAFVREYLTFYSLVDEMFPGFEHDVLLQLLAKTGMAVEAASALREYAIYVSNQRRLYGEAYSKDYFANMVFAAMSNKQPVAALRGIKEDAGLGAFIADFTLEEEKLGLCYGNLVEKSTNVKASLNAFTILIIGLKERKNKPGNVFGNLFAGGGRSSFNMSALFEALALSPDIDAAVAFVTRLHKIFPSHDFGMNYNLRLFEQSVRKGLSAREQDLLCDFCRWYWEFYARHGTAGNADLAGFFHTPYWQEDAGFLLAPGNTERFEAFLARCPAENHLNAISRMKFYFELFAWLGTNDPTMLDGFIRGEVSLQRVAVRIFERGRKRGDLVQGAAHFFPLSAVSRGLRINVKVAHYLLGKIEILPLIARLDDPAFRRRIQAISYSLNREVTLSPAERRLNEDDKTNLFDLLFSADDLAFAEEMFAAFFRNESGDYGIEIPKLVELLSNVEIADVTRIIRAIKENPKESIEEVADILKKQFADPRLQARIIWILENCFVLEDRLDALQSLTKTIAGSGMGSAELIALLQDIDKAKTFAALSRLVSERAGAEQGAMRGQVLAFKIESLGQEPREDLICEAICAFDSLDDREGAYNLLLEHFGNLPDSSKLRVLMKALYVSASKNNAVVAATLQSIFEGKPIKGQEISRSRAALIAELFGQMGGVSMRSGTAQAENPVELIRKYFVSAGEIADPYARKEALNQLSSLFVSAGRAYSGKKLSGEAGTALDSLAVFLEIGDRRHAIPHVFFQPLLVLKADKRSLETIRGWCELVNTTGTVRNQTARLKSDLYEKIRTLASFDGEGNGAVLSQVINLTVRSFEEREGELSRKNLEQFTRELLKNLEETVMVVSVHEQAAKGALDPRVSALMRETSNSLLQELRAGRPFDREKLALVRGLESQILLSSFASSLQLSGEEAEQARQRLIAYAAGSRFSWQDHQGRNLYRLVEEYVRTFINFKAYMANDTTLQQRYMVLVRTIYEALMHETAGDFKEWRYRSPDYTETIDEIIRIEVSRLSGQRQEEFKRLTGVIEEGSLADKLEAIEGFDDVRQAISRVRLGWEQNAAYSLASSKNGEKIAFTDDFRILFNIGNYPGSTACQSCTYISTLKAGLTGYVAHGTNKTVALLDSRDIVVSRRIVRLRVVTDSQGMRKAVILVEEKAQHGSAQAEQLYAALAILSRRTGLPVVFSTGSAVAQVSSLPGTDRVMDISVYKGRSFDYSDLYGYEHPGMVTAGLYEQLSGHEVIRKTLRTMEPFQGMEEDIAGRFGMERIAEAAPIADGGSLNAALEKFAREFHAAGGMPKMSEHFDFLRAAGRRANFNVKTVYNPFGGFDPVTAFMVSGGASEVYSVGSEDFGTPDDIVRFFSSTSLHAKRQILDRKLDTLNDMKALERAHTLTGLGGVALLRLIAGMDAEITAVRYFELEPDGQMRFFDGTQPQRMRRGRNCCVEFKSAGAFKRYWYIQHDVLRQETGFTSFMEKLRFDGMMIKAVPRMWDWDASLMLGLDAYPEWEGFIREVNRMTVIPARREQARVIADIDLAPGGKYVKKLGPHPIFRGNPDSLLLENGQKFGYSMAGDRLYFGDAGVLKQPGDIERYFLGGWGALLSQRDHCSDFLLRYFESKKDGLLSSGANAYIYMYMRHPDRQFRDMVARYDNFEGSYIDIFDFIENSLATNRVDKAHPAYQRYGKMIDEMLKADVLSDGERRNLQYIVSSLNEGLHRYIRLFSITAGEVNSFERGFREEPRTELDGGEKTVSPGGIDFRALPLQRGGVDARRVFAGISGSAGRMDIGAEWSAIQTMVNRGIIPSCERIREYAGACYQQGVFSARAPALAVFMADLLRLEESRSQATDPVLKDILVLLET